MTKTNDLVIPVERIEHAIFEIRGQRVMMDVDLAALYGVETGALVRAVKRNLDRFPADFTFQLTASEFRILRCQSGISSRWGGRRFLPYAFAEQGVAMLSSVLHSKQAIRVNVEIMRVFVRLRRMMVDQQQFALKLAEIESKLAEHDQSIKVVFDAIRQLMATPKPKPVRKIGFQVREPLVAPYGTKAPRTRGKRRDRTLKGKE